MEPRISFITLGVADLPRAIAFYEGTLGLRQRDTGAAGVAFFPMGPTMLALWSREELARDAGQIDPSPRDGFGGIALAHNVGSVAAVDELLAQAASGGGRLVKPGHATDWGGYAGYFADPDGHLWEVAWNPHMPEF